MCLIQPTKVGFVIVAPAFQAESNLVYPHAELGKDINFPKDNPYFNLILRS